MSGGGPDSGRVGNIGMGAYGAVGKARGRRGQRDVTAGRSGGPEGAARLNRIEEEEKIPGIPAAAPEISALREAADLQNYFSDLQRIALGGIEAQEALSRFGIAPEQRQFSYRSSFPEFGDLSGTPGGLSGIIRELGLMSRTPEKFVEGGRAGESFNRPGQSEVQTDVAKFGNMLKDLMLIEDKPTGQQAERLEMAREAGAISPAMAMREGAQFQPGGLMPRGVNPPMPTRIGDRLSEPRSVNLRPMPTRIGDIRNNEPINIIPEALTPEIEVERPSSLGQLGRIPSVEENTQLDTVIVQEYRDNNDNLRIAPYEYFRSQGLFPRDAQKIVDGMSPAELALFNEQSQELSERAMAEAFPNIQPSPPGVAENLKADLEALGLKDGGSVLDIDSIAQRTRMIGEEEAFPTEGGESYKEQKMSKIIDRANLSEDEKRLGMGVPLEDWYPQHITEQLLQKYQEQIDVTEDEKRLEDRADQRYLELYATSPNYPEGTGVTRAFAYNILRSMGLTGRQSHDIVNSMTEDKLNELYENRRPSEMTGMKDGGSVRGRTDALPLVEGDHVVPAHAVKGNEGGLASLSKKLTGNRNYDGMIRGPGGPRDDAINTRVYAGGGGIAGKMDNLQNPFNSVPARVSNKEYVIPRDAITNLGLMTGAREGDANKAGQDIIYELVESLKRKK